MIERRNKPVQKSLLLYILSSILGNSIDGFNTFLKKELVAMDINDRSYLMQCDWLALNGAHSVFGEKKNDACVYKDEYHRYGAVSEHSEQAYKDLASIVQPGRVIYVMGEGEKIEYPEWNHLMTIAGVMMVLEKPISPPEIDYIKLGLADEDRIVELGDIVGMSVDPRSYEMGDFLGVERDGKLVSIAGEGIVFDEYREIKDVRTHPDFRRRGYGGGLTSLLSHRIQERGETPVLKVVADNTNAIRLYEKLGFRICARGFNYILQRTNVTV